MSSLAYLDVDPVVAEAGEAQGQPSHGHDQERVDYVAQSSVQTLALHTSAGL